MHSPLCSIPQSTFKLKQYIVLNNTIIYQYYVYYILFVFPSKRYAEAWPGPISFIPPYRVRPGQYLEPMYSWSWQSDEKEEGKGGKKKNTWFIHWDYKGSGGIWTRLREMKGLVWTSVLSGGAHSCAVMLGIERKVCGCEWESAVCSLSIPFSWQDQGSPVPPANRCE